MQVAEVSFNHNLSPKTQDVQKQPQATTLT